MLSFFASTRLSAQAQALQQVSTHQLHNVWQLSTRVLSGSEPENEAAFAELARLGIKTVVSVDGIAPKTELAKKHGLRYVHIPIGYDGIPASSQAALVRVAREIPGNIYVHCHHGKHRGPAAAAILCRADDGRSTLAARAILEMAGTGKEYAGLWRDVEKFKLPPADQPLPDLVEQATVESLTNSMANLDRTFDRLKSFSKNQWQPLTEHPDLVATQEALLLQESFTESARAVTSPGKEQLIADLKLSAQLAKQLRAAIQQNRPTDADKLMSQLTSQCTKCHQAHRNQ